MEKGKRAKTVALISAIITAATPGVYAGIKSAEIAWKQHVESKKADVQEAALAKNVEALKSEFSALEKACVTHKDLLDLTLKMRTVANAPVVRRPSRPAVSRVESELSKKVDVLRKRLATAKVAKSKARAQTKAAPLLKSSESVRIMIQKKSK